MNNKTFIQVRATAFGCELGIVEFRTGGFDQKEKWSAAVTVPFLFLDPDRVVREARQEFIMGVVEALQRELDNAKTRLHSRVTVHIPRHRLPRCGWQNNGYYIEYLVRGGVCSVYLPGAVLTNIVANDHGLTFNTQRQYVNDDLAAYIVT